MMRKDIIDTERKTPAENAQTFALTLCVGFTATMVICLIFATLFAGEEAKQGIGYCWSILAACAVAAALQFIFFTPVIIKRMAYPARLAIFGICLYAVLAAAAIAMRWFPIDMAGSWISFTVTYLVMLAGATAFFHFKAKHEERILNEKLDEYQKNAR